MSDKVIRTGFYLAGLVNILGITLVSHGLQSDTLVKADPAVFSNFGILCIMLWGLAYIASAPHATAAIFLPAVFALEKLLYTVNWVQWFAAHGGEVESITQQDMLGGLFLGGYGVVDGVFCLFFAMVALNNWNKRKNQ